MNEKRSTVWRIQQQRKQNQQTWRKMGMEAKDMQLAVYSFLPYILPTSLLAQQGRKLKTLTIRRKTTPSDLQMC